MSTSEGVYRLLELDSDGGLNDGIEVGFLGEVEEVALLIPHGGGNTIMHIV